MRKRGEVTVFLSLILVCVLSLFMGLLESARTAGSRLYLRMAADSSMASVMSLYNRNLWDMYDLMFLEYESEEAVTQSFAEFFRFYEEQENLYPMRLSEVKITETESMTAGGGAALEKQIAAWIPYRLPDIAADLAGLTGAAAEAAKAADFEELLTVCRQAGKATRKLEKRRSAVENSLLKSEELWKKTITAAENESAGRFLREARTLKRELGGFPGRVDAYEKEIQRLKESREREQSETAAEEAGSTDSTGIAEITENTGSTGAAMGIETAAGADPDAKEMLGREISAIAQVLEEAEKKLSEYREDEACLEAAGESLDQAIALVEEFEESRDPEDEEEGDPDWDEVLSCLNETEIPVPERGGEVDEKKAAALDRLEELFDGSLLELVLPKGTEISKLRVPSKSSDVGKETDGDSRTDTGDSIAPITRLLVGEYIGIYFDSFLEKGEGGAPEGEKPLAYEQEYILNGEPTDRENLAGTVQRLLSVRGAANLLFLLNSPERKAEADALAEAVSAGNVPVQFIVSFLILTLWAFGEAILDVRALLAGKRVPLWKSETSWKTGLAGLLEAEFLSMDADAFGETEGNDYGEYLRILNFLQDRAERNERLLRLIEWNVRKKQADFAVDDCVCRMKILARTEERHLFLLKTAYTAQVTADGGYLNSG